jgi:cytochrome c-type biogenesis protein
VSELQALLTDWLTELAAVLPFGFAFGVGMVAVVNPCGFAMLPAYLSLYLGAHEDDFGKSPSMTRLLRRSSSAQPSPRGSSYSSAWPG